MGKFETIDDYIASFPEHTQEILKKLRATIHDAVPELTEDMAYGMPTFKYKGRNMVHFAGWEAHIGFYPTPSGIEQFSEFKQYKTGKGTLQFPLDKPIPYDLVAKVAKFRTEEIDKK